MWKWLMDLLPDLKQGTFEVRDLLNLLMTGLGAYLAWLAIKMGREQGQIATRQGQIAETQHLIMQEHLAKKSQLSLVLFRTERAGRFAVAISNEGNKTNDACYWMVSIPSKYDGRIIVQVEESDEPMKRTLQHYIKGIHHSVYGTDFIKPIFQGSQISVAFITITNELFNSRGASVDIVWSITGEDGSFPAHNLHGIIKLPLSGSVGIDRIVSSGEVVPVNDPEED